MSLVLSLAYPTSALPSSLYLSPWAAPRGAPPPQVPLWCHVRHFARKSHLGKDRKDKINKFPLALGGAEGFCKEVVVAECGLWWEAPWGVGRELEPWSWWATQGSRLGLCVVGLLLKVLDPFPKARRAACLCFCGPSPRAQHGSSREGGRRPSVSTWRGAADAHTRGHSRDVELGPS